MHVNSNRIGETVPYIESDNANKSSDPADLAAQKPSSKPASQQSKTAYLLTRPRWEKNCSIRNLI